MLKILNENYYFDFDKIQDFINIPSDSGETDTQVSVVKYEIVKIMLETLLTENETIDETLGMKSSGLSIPFKLAFNTLLNKQIINKY